MQDLAQASGLEKASLYHHFRSKETLVLEIISTAMTTAIAKLDGVLEDKSITSPTEKLRAAIIALVDDVCGELDASVAFTVMTDGEILSPALRAQYIGLRDTYENRFKSIIAAGIGSREFQDCRANVVAKGILGMIAWVTIWYRPNGALTPTEIGEELADLAISGLRNKG